MLCLPRNLHFEVHQVLCLSHNQHFEVHKVLHLSRNLRFEVHQARCLPRNLQASHMSKSHGSLHLSRNLSSSTITTMSKVLHLPRKLHFEIKTVPIPCTCHEKLPRKMTTMYQNAHGATTRAQSLEAPAADTQILRACAVEMHIDDVERHECTVNSIELAVHARALQRSKHQLPFPYRKNPSVCPHCLGKKTCIQRFVLWGGSAKTL